MCFENTRLFCVERLALPNGTRLLPYFFTNTIVDEFVPRGDLLSRLMWVLPLGGSVQASFVVAVTSPFGPLKVRDDERLSVLPSNFPVSETGRSHRRLLLDRCRFTIERVGHARISDPKTATAATHSAAARTLGSRCPSRFRIYLDAFGRLSDGQRHRFYTIRARSSNFDLLTSSVHVPEKSVVFACANAALPESMQQSVSAKVSFSCCLLKK